MWGLKPPLPGRGTSTLYEGIICNGVAWSPDLSWETLTLMLQWAWEGPSPKHSPWAEAGENLSFPVWASPGQVSGENAAEEKQCFRSEGPSLHPAPRADSPSQHLLSHLALCPNCHHVPLCSAR